MKLTRYSDYALRVCLYLALHSDRLVSIPEIVQAYDLPRGNIMKLTTDLVGAGLIESVRGRAGGIRLARPAAEITIGQIVRHTEKEQPMVDCSTCILAPDCGLICILNAARQAFFQALDGHTLAEVVTRSPHALSRLLAAFDTRN